jgi:hypothetical protein
MKYHQWDVMLWNCIIHLIILCTEILIMGCGVLVVIDFQVNPSRWIKSQEI